jgi:hypothetical protein
LTTKCNQEGFQWGTIQTPHCKMFKHKWTPFFHVSRPPQLTSPDLLTYTRKTEFPLPGTKSSRVSVAWHREFHCHCLHSRQCPFSPQSALSSSVGRSAHLNTYSQPPKTDLIQ